MNLSLDEHLLRFWSVPSSVASLPVTLSKSDLPWFYLMHANYSIVYHFCVVLLHVGTRELISQQILCSSRMECWIHGSRARVYWTQTRSWPTSLYQSLESHQSMGLLIPTQRAWLLHLAAGLLQWLPACKTADLPARWGYEHLLQKFCIPFIHKFPMLAIFKFYITFCCKVQTR